MRQSYIRATLILVPILTIILLVTSCKKDENNNGNPAGSLEFVSLVAEKDTINLQELTSIKATVKGTNLTYSWSCDNELGIIEGSGAEVLFTICHAGKFKITCTAADNNNNQVSRDTYVTTME